MPPKRPPGIIVLRITHPCLTVSCAMMSIGLPPSCCRNGVRHSSLCRRSSRPPLSPGYYPWIPPRKSSQRYASYVAKHSSLKALSTTHSLSAHLTQHQTQLSLRNHRQRHYEIETEHIRRSERHMCPSMDKCPGCGCHWRHTRASGANLQQQIQVSMS